MGEYHHPMMGMYTSSPSRDPSAAALPLSRSPTSLDRRFACAPFFVPSIPSSPYIIRNPSRLRGGGGGRRERTNRSSTSRRSDPSSISRVKTRSSRASPLTDLDKLKIEEAAVKSEVARLSLSLRDVEGDGNCLFRALSDQLYGDQKRHPEIRKLTCDYLESHEVDLGYWAGLCSFLDGEDYAAYVKRMRKSGQYASEVEVHAAARMLQRSIRIVHSDHSETIPCDYDPSSAPSATPPAEERPDMDTDNMEMTTPTRLRRRTRSSTICLLSEPAAPPPSSPLYASALAQYLPPIRDGRSMLWLALFNDAEHYQSVRRKGDRERGPAEVEDRLALPHEKDKSESARIARGEMTVPTESQDKSTAPLLARVLASLPVGHTFTSNYISGILARVKGDVGEAVEILLEEYNADDDGSDGSTGTGSDIKVEQMLIDPPIDPNIPICSSPILTSPEPSPPGSPIPYRRIQATHVGSPAPPPDSPGSSMSTASHSHESDISHSSKATTPSTHSDRSKRSISGGSGKAGKDRSKPYDRPTTGRKGKELSKEVEDLKIGGSGDILEQRRRSTGGQNEKGRKTALEELKEARARSKSRMSVGVA